MTTKWVPKKQIELVLKREFIAPFIDSIRQDPVISLKLSNAFDLIRVSEQIIIEFDKKRVEAGENVEAVREKTLFLGYLGKVYQSALLLIGATDYLGAMILLRSVFELLIGIATKENGSMRDKISSISFLDNDEKNNLQKLWNELSAWAHPYGKWVKNICPKFYGSGRYHHPVIFSQCLGYSDQILDLMLTITLVHFNLSPENYTDKYREITEIEKILAISKLEMFERRLTRSP
ncbi:MAG: hypothetical protein NT072_10475 [Deltaproteobacteria bacterium]|nr:hypothetical protein [Deltaproteobacteria bacterium]